MRELEHKVEDNRIKREGEERELQTKVDILRDECSKLQSEKNLKETEVAETRDKINETKTEIMKVTYLFCEKSKAFISVSLILLAYLFTSFVGQCSGE